MPFNFKAILGGAMIVALSATGIRADSISTGYDINRLLNQGHPFAHRTGTKWRPAATLSARAGARGKPLGGVVSEISLGVPKHDQGPFTNTKEDGIDAHIEIRFKSPDFLDIIWGPEPHIGANFNSRGDAS